MGKNSKFLKTAIWRSSSITAPVLLSGPIDKSKKLVVVDLEKTLVYESHSNIFERPYIIEFLQEKAPHYNISIWSDWPIDKVLKTLNFVNIQPNCFSFILGAESMDKERFGTRFVGTKKLSFVWENLKDYDACNTIAIDDTSETFMCNKKEGIKVRKYRANEEDNELLLLAVYLKRISKIPDFTLIRHSKWKESV